MPAQISIKSKEDVAVAIKDKTFLIPQNYLVGRYTDRDKEEQSALIQFYYPEMKPINDKRVMSTVQFKENTIIRVVLNGNGDIKDSNTFIKYLKQIQEKIFRKEQYSYFGKTSDLHLYKNSSPNLKANDNSSDKYFDDLDTPKTYINCTGLRVAKQRIPYPSCEMYFNYRDIAFSVNFQRPLLPKWVDLKQKTKAMFDEFEKKSIHLQVL